jgi:addiction module HigA family antidote
MTRKNGMRPVHPGEVLRDELEELEMSARSFAEALSVPPNRITAVLNGQRGITADTALRLARYLGTSPEMWMNLQKSYELRLAEIEAGKEIIKQVQPGPKAA